MRIVPLTALLGSSEIIRRTALRALASRLRVDFRLHQIAQTSSRIILNLHRVAEPDGSAYVPLNPEIFEELLVFLKQHFELLTFENKTPCMGRPQAILSFDDGYKDFIDVAAPLLSRHRVRCNHNLIPQCLESGLAPLNVLAQDFVGKAPKRVLHSLHVPGFTIDERPRLGWRLSAFIKNRPQLEQRALAEVLLPQFFAWDGFRPTPMMNVQEARQLASEHEFGAHSWSHASMEFETEDYLREDVQRCQEFFQRKLGSTVNIYAFPNGSHAPGQLELVEQAGIRHVLLVGEKFDTHPSRHERFTFHASNIAEMRFRATGGLCPIPK